MKFNYTPVEISTSHLEVVNEDGNGRLYRTPSGMLLPSVTTVTGFEGKRGMEIWRSKNPREANRVVERGHTIHSMMENLLKNEEVELTGNEDVDSLYHMLREQAEKKITNVYALEQQLWSESIGLSGRVDCICDYDGKLSVVDFKGATREKYESGIQNYFQQATAYSIMFQEITGRKVEQIVILIATETGIVQEFVKKPFNYVEGLVEAINKYKKWISEREPTLFS